MHWIHLKVSRFVVRSSLMGMLWLGLPSMSNVQVRDALPVDGVGSGVDAGYSTVDRAVILFKPAGSGVMNGSLT